LGARSACAIAADGNSAASAAAAAATAVPLACQGDWVRMHKYEGWAHGNALCGSPVTTCN
jgi:hypothetical protein